MAYRIHPFHVIVIALAGWINRQQQAVIDYHIEENRVLKSQYKGKQLMLTDTQRGLLAAKAKDVNFSIIEAYLISHEIVGKYGRYQKHTNALNLTMSGAILDDPGILKIGELLDC